jgi:putative transposase
MGGHRRQVLEPHRDFIVGRISEMPHLTLYGLKEEA